tara:strand:+ start:533 stop:1195 length:663 start_codon:yes stop_codon:yes gene_type:complete
MKILKILAVSALLVAGINAKSFADSSNFAGPYIGVSGSAVGVAMDGKHTDGDADASVTKGAAGTVSMAVGVEVGYNVPVSDVAFITIAASYNPVDADFKADDAANANDVTVTFGDIMEVSVEPSFSVTSNTAFFVKAAYSEFTADAKGTGLDNSQAFDITGDTFALGTKTITANGIYIKSEVGMTTYGGFTLKDVGTDDGTAVVDDIDIAYGKIMIGKKF